MGLFGRSGRDGRRGEERAEPKLFSDRRSSWRRGGPSRFGEPRSPRPAVFTVLSWIMTLGLWGMLVAAAVVGYAFLSLDKQGLFQIPEREPGIMLLAADGNVLAERGSFFGDEVRVDELPAYVPQAVIAIEDRRFYQHFGVDFLGLLRAGFANLQAGRVVEGGSTITQQLAKNLFLKPERTMERKLQEAVLALLAREQFHARTRSCSSISTASITAPAPSASRRRRRTSLPSRPATSTWPEAAILAAVLKAPTTTIRSTIPTRHARAALVISDMVEAGFITRERGRSRGHPQDGRDQACRAMCRRPNTSSTMSASSCRSSSASIDQSIVVETTIDREAPDRRREARCATASRARAPSSTPRRARW